GETVLSSVRVGKTRDPVVIGDQRARKLDCRRDEKPIRRIAMFEMMKLIGTRRDPVRDWHRRDAGAREKTLDPCVDRDIEIDTSGVDEQCDLPGSDRTQEDAAAFPPAAIDQAARRLAQPGAAAIEPKGNMRIEEDRIGHRSISFPLSASSVSSK